MVTDFNSISKSQPENKNYPIVAINLLYARNAKLKENIKISNVFYKYCASHNLEKFIHLSSIDVCGRINGLNITEDMQVKPYTEYAKIKYKLEQYYLDKFKNKIYQCVILRSGNVYGEGLPGIEKIVHRHTKGNRVINKIRTLLYGSRSLNIIEIDNLISAIRYFIDVRLSHINPIYYVTDDHDKNSNYRYLVDAINKRKTSKDNISFINNITNQLLKCILFINGSDNIEPSRKYLPKKIQQLGYSHEISIKEGIEKYLIWYNKKYSH